MFRIGAFARLTGVSAKRLRHYDRLGLFRPAWVDPDTGYRGYVATQIPELRRIVALSDLGIPLRRIRELRDGGVSLAAELERRRTELEEERREAERRLAALDIHLEQTGDLDVVVRQRPPGRWGALRATVERGGDLGPLFVELEEHVAAHDARASLPPACVVHRRASGEIDLELLVPVDRRIPPKGRVRPVSTPPTPVAAALVTGGYDRLAEAAEALASWAERTGHVPDGPPWHVYLRFGAEEHLALPGEFLTDRREELVTEVQLPIRPVPG